MSGKEWGGRDNQRGRGDNFGPYWDGIAVSLIVHGGHEDALHKSR
jgi:hypothetical protein